MSLRPSTAAFIDTGLLLGPAVVGLARRHVRFVKGESKMVSSVDIWILFLTRMFMYASQEPRKALSCLFVYYYVSVF